MTNIKTSIHEILRDAGELPESTLVERVASDVGVAPIVVVDTLDEELRQGLCYRVQSPDGPIIKRTAGA